MNSIPYLVGWTGSDVILKDEMKQLTEEGRDPKWIDALLGKMEGQFSQADIWSRLQEAPLRSEFRFREPSDLEGIRRERVQAQRRWTIDYSENELFDRMHGVWLGRCCGCALGKPVERFMGPYNGLSSRERIKTYLQAIAPQEYPLNDYFPIASPAQAQTGSVSCHASCRENIAFMETDDDIRYTVLAQKVLLNCGGSFTSLDVMKAWLGMLTYLQVCTAENQAYRNFVLRYPRSINDDGEVDWTWVAAHQNPYREWIGAQIRADSWGYAAAGNPELAAEFAWRDARISHVKNGIYGEMFVAAMIAAGFVLEEPLAVIQAGLAEIPQTSRLYEEMLLTIEICRKNDFKADAFEEVLHDIYQSFGHYDAVHTNNNAALVVAALLLGGDDFEKVITIAVMGGWDTDCNGATAGSIFGAMHGAHKIPSKWRLPLQDTLYSEVSGYHPIAISECAKRSLDIALKIRNQT